MDVVSFEVDKDIFLKKSEQAKLWLIHRSTQDHGELAPIPEWLLWLVKHCEGCIE